MHMKPYLIFLALVLLSLTGAHAASGISARATAAAGESTMLTHHDASSTLPDAQFAQIEGGSHAPLSSGSLLTLVVVAVVALRLMGLNRARAMADHERNTYQARAEMYRWLHANGERTDRR